MGLARVRFGGSDLFLCRLAGRLARIGSAIHYGFPLLVCYMCRNVATTGNANVARNKEIRREEQAKRCSRARSLAAGLALIMVSPGVLAQEPLHDIDIPSLNAAEALNELAEQTGAVMLFPYDLVVNRQANAVVGRFTLTGALEAILEGSGLSGGLSDRRVVQIVIEESSEGGQIEASTEAPINQQGDTEMPSDNRTGFWRGLTATLGLAATAAIPGQGQAQAPNASAVPATLEEIVVTARRREELLVDVPVSISVLNADFMQLENLVDTNDLYAVTAGVDYVEIGGSRSGSLTTIRGVSPGSQGALAQKMTVFLDGVPIVGSNGSTFQYLDLERVELLRGPQSAAFGRATFAGAINYVTRDPGDEFDAAFKIIASDLNRTLLGANFDGPITDTLGFTLDLYEEDFEGPDEWITTDGLEVGATNTQHIAAKLKFAPNDFFDMELSASYTGADDGQSAQYSLPRGTAPACNNIVLGNMRPYVQGEWDCELGTGPMPVFNDLTQDGFVQGTPAYNQALSYSVLDPTDTRERQRIAGEFNFSFDNGGLLQAIVSSATDESLRWASQGGVEGQTTNFRGMFNPMLTLNMGVPSGSDKENYLDVRWISPDDSSLRWMVGASHYEFEYTSTVFLQYAGVAFPELGLEDLVNRGMAFLPRRRTDQATEATGLYGSFAWDISDRTTASFEGRFQRDNNLTLDVVSGNTVDQTTDSFQPRLAVTHSLNEAWSVYGQISQGTNPAVANPQMIDPLVQAATEAAFAAGVIDFTADQFTSTDEEELTNYEFGIKGNALDGRVQLAAAIYVIDWQDMILGESFFFGSTPPVMGSCAGVPGCWNDGSFDPNGVIYPPTTSTLTGVRLNSGSGDLKGIEFEANWLATDRWSYRASLSLQDNKYDENCDLSAAGRQPRAGGGYGFAPDCVTAGGLPGKQVAGNEIETNSDVQASVSASYTAPLAGNWRWGANLGVRHKGSAFYDVVNIAEIPAVTTATGQINFSNDNWEIILFGNNLTDEDTIVHMREWFELTLRGDRNTWTYLPRRPREIGLRVNFTF